MPVQPQDWFEFDDLKRRRYDTQVWIPLSATQTNVLASEERHVGYQEDFLLAGSVMVPVASRDLVLTAEANDILDTMRSTPMPYVSEGKYIPTDTAHEFFEGLDGIRLVLEQRIAGVEHTDWQLNQDLVFALNLKRVGDNWVRVEEGRDIVARLHRDGEGKAVRLDIKAEYLKDYLAARGMGLALGTYHNRIEISAEDPQFDWERPIAGEENEAQHWRWESRIQETHEDGMPFGEKMAVFEMRRTDFDADDEVPVLEHGKGEVESKKYDVPLGKGDRVYRISGELWRTQWVNPAEQSPRVLHVDIPSTSYFVVNGAGERRNGDNLKSHGDFYLWFRPEIVNDVLSHPDGFIGWNTADTATLGFAPDQGVHIGINEEGYVNVLAVDIGRLPRWSQAKWAAHNVGPTGKVSRELISIQVEVNIPHTHAPEAHLKEALDDLAAAVHKRYGIKLFRGDEHEGTLLRSIHRFRSINFEGLLGLAKDITRLVADRIDAKALQKASLKEKPEQTLGSLKSLERALAPLIPPDKAATLCGALFGIYELRKADAHLPPSDLSAELKLANVKDGDSPVSQGRSMLIALLVTLAHLVRVFSSDLKA